ncbi:MAG: AAA family ATPase, partial [Butyrivibrio sp.]|nr:AAA family ATPase [Butyrivibrio sp.]
NMLASFSEAQIVGKIFVISDKEPEERSVNKLDGADGILKKLGSGYLKASSQAGNIKTSVIDVASICGGCGKTRVAIGIAKALCDMRKKVLYIDAENIQNFYEILEPDNAEGRKYIEGAQANELLTPDSCRLSDIDEKIVKDKFDYLAPLKGSLMRYQLCADMLVTLAETAAAENVYDYIVLEHGTGYDARFLERLNRAEKIVLCKSAGSGFTARCENFLSDIRQFEGQMVIAEAAEEPEDAVVLGIPVIPGGSYRKIAEAIM